MITHIEESEHARVFTQFRPLLFTIAYEILGSATEADDVLQEGFLRWSEVDLQSLDHPRAYLSRLVARQALNALRAAARRREDYVGPWLPEPIMIDDTDPAGDAVLAESVSMAMLVVLETLGPEERTVFVLREVFDFSHREIADILGKSESATRQMAHRSRAHVRARRPRRPEGREDWARVTAEFMTASATGDLDGLLAVLAPDATWTADGGGKVTAARRPVHGAENVARLVLGMVRLGGAEGRAEPSTYNGAPALALTIADRPEGVVVLDITDGRITHLYVVRNPDKLATVGTARSLRRATPAPK